MTSMYRARLRPLTRRLTAALAGGGLLASGLVAGSLVAAAPAQAAAPKVACTWIEAGGFDNRENTFRCTNPGPTAERVVHRDCWMYEPPADSVVRVKVGQRWQKTEAQIDIRKATQCPETHPWLTRVQIPTDGLKPYVTTRYRFIMPAHEVTVDDEVIEVDKAILNMYVCMMREGKDRECP
jgi:hypothetical protein